MLVLSGKFSHAMLEVQNCCVDKLVIIDSLVKSLVFIVKFVVGTCASVHWLLVDLPLVLGLSL